MKQMKMDYKEIISELNEEVSQGSLTLQDEIQILRQDQPVFESYCPVIDWYYDEYVMKEDLETPLEDIYLEEEFSKEEWEEMKKDRDAYLKQYQEDRPKLITMSVKEVITELKQIMKLF